MKFAPGSRWRAVCVAVALWGITIAAQAATELALDYTVAQRDTLIGVGRDLLVRPSAWPEVARLNRLPDPNRIQPGQRLKIPLRLLRGSEQPARIVSVEGDVRLDGAAVGAGASLAIGQRLVTSSQGSAVVELGDGTRVKLVPGTEAALAEHTRFQLKAGSTDGAGQGAGLFASSMRLVSGAVEIAATKVLRAKPLEVSTPTAVIGVRGTEFRVRSDGSASAATRSEVLEGQVQAQAQTDAATGVAVAAGFGVALRPGQAPSVVPLLPAPDLSELPALFERPLVRLQLSGESTPLRLQVASDPAFELLVRDELIAAGSEIRVAGLDDGNWQLRLRRVDPLGIEGLDANRAMTLKARPEPPVAAAPRAGAKLPAGEVALAWAENTEAIEYRLQVALDQQFSQGLKDLDHLRGGGTRLTLETPGVYHWRVSSIRAGGDRGPWGDAQRFELRPLPEPPQGGLAADGNSLELRWAGRSEDRQQVELARDLGFKDVVAQAELTEPRWDLPVPEQAGLYYFRYRSVESDGFVSPWSSTLKFEVPRDWRFLWLLLPLALTL